MKNEDKTKNKVLRKLTEFVNMRFQIKDTRLYDSQHKHKPQEPPKSEPISPFKTPTSPSKSPTSTRKKPPPPPPTPKIKTSTQQSQPLIEPPKQLKLRFLQKISTEHFLIGNEYQLDLIKIVGIIDNFVDTEHIWSLSCPEPILSLSVETKACLFILSGSKTTFAYKYNIKNDNSTEPPNLMVQRTHEQKVQQVRFANSTGVYVLLQQCLEFYRISWVYEQAQMDKYFTYSYDLNNNKSIFSVPPTIEGTLNIFFAQTKTKAQEQTTFGLWKQSFTIYPQADKPEVHRMEHIYDIDVDLRDKIVILNYSPEICLIQFQNQMLAFRNGFVVDNVSTNFHKQNCFIKYIANSRTLVHFLENTIDFYRFAMNETVRPQRITLECQDSIQFICERGQLFGILQLYNGAYIFFYWLNSVSRPRPCLQYTFTMTQEINVQAKVNEIYPTKEQLKKYSSQQLHDKCEVVRKMGLTAQQAYYELWKRSSRQSYLDYQILLSIGDFPIIQAQIEKKLKHNMSFQTVIRIYQQCLKILQGRVFGQKCTLTDLQQYASCHFVLKKFNMYRNVIAREQAATDLLEVREEDERDPSLEISQQPLHTEADQTQNTHTNTHKQIKIGIKVYLELKQMSIVGELIQLISTYLFKPSKKLINKLQYLFRYFKLIYRIHYQTILEKIVQISKARILEVLKAMPQLLPYINDEQRETEFWGKLSQEQVESNLLLSSLTTIDNQTVVEDFSRSIWFKRNLNVNHGVIAQDLPLESTNTNYDDIFYMFLCRVHALKLPTQQRRAIITHLEHNYPLMPRHLNGKLQLYIELYELYHTFDDDINLLIFLRSGEPQLFKMHFEHEKQQKRGFILRQIKSLYEKHGLVKQVALNMKQLRKYFDFSSEVLDEIKSIYESHSEIAQNLGCIRSLSAKYGLSDVAIEYIQKLYDKQLVEKVKLFNDGMYQYFSSNQSSVSDLKCIFNKLNNESNDFHLLKSSQNLYEVLISAIMQKLKIGSDNDTPIDQILVYIENIPFPIHNDNIMKNLAQIQQINYESDMLRKIKVNMTLVEIMKKGEEVIELMVEHEVKRHDVHKVHDYRTLKLYAYKILAEIQCRKSNIYGEEYNSYSLKKFLANIMTTCEMITLSRQLLRDKFLIGEFNINIPFIESLVILLYQWKLCENNKDDKDYYMAHEVYIRSLLQLLDTNNMQRQFIELSLEYARLLTWQHPNGFKITYPLFPSFHYYPSLRDVEEVFNSFTEKQLRSVQLQELFSVMIRLKRLGESIVDMQGKPLDYQNKVRQQLYEIYITRLIEQKQIKLALKYIFTLLQIPNDYPEYNIVFPILIIEKLFPEVLPGTVLLLNKIISHYFDDPLALAKVLHELFSDKFTTDSLNNKLNEFISRRKDTRIYGYNNPILNCDLLLSDQQDIDRNNELVEWILNRIQQINEVYRKSYQLHIVFRIMCQRPLVLAKWIWCKKSGLNLKILRSFLSYMSLEILFDTETTLKQSKKIFGVLGYKFTQPNFFNEIIKFIHKINLSADKMGPALNGDEKACKMIRDSINKFDIKLFKFRTKQNQLFIKNNSIIRKIKTKQNYSANKSEYIYEDEDDNYDHSNEELSLKGKKRQKINATFDRRIEGREEVSKYTNYVTRKQLDYIPLPASHKKRKASEYFPEMMNFDQNFKKSRFNLNQFDHQSEHNNFSEEPADIDIPDLDLEMPSAVRVVIHSPRPTPYPEERSPIFAPGNIVRTDSIILPDDTDHMENTKSQLVQSQEMNDSIVAFDPNTEQLLKTQQIAEKLLNSSVSQKQKLRLLSEIPHQDQQKLKHSLDLLLNDIYTNSKFDKYPFTQRMQLILNISHRFENSVCNKTVIGFFQKLSKFRQIQDLPFKVKTMFPACLLLKQHTQEEIFSYFRSKVQPYITSINIHLVISFIDNCFSLPTAKDDLITDFALKKVKAAIPQNQGNDCRDIVCGLMMSMSRGRQRIAEEAQKLAANRKIHQSILLKQCLEDSINPDFTI